MQVTSTETFDYYLFDGDIEILKQWAIDAYNTYEIFIENITYKENKKGYVLIFNHGIFNREIIVNENNKHIVCEKVNRGYYITSYCESEFKGLYNVVKEV